MFTVVENKKIFQYQILEKMKAGMVLTGQEVKSIKRGQVSLSGSFVVVKREEVFLIGTTIPPYQPKNAPKDYDPQRSRKLLLTKKEIKYLIGKNRQKGLTMIPLKIFLERKRLKLEFGIVKSKKKFNKREEIKKKEIKRMIQRKLKTEKID